MPGEDAGGFTRLDPHQHFVEDGSARSLGTSFLDEDIDDVETFPLGKLANLGKLILDAPSLPVVVLGRFAAVDEKLLFFHTVTLARKSFGAKGVLVEAQRGTHAEGFQFSVSGYPPHMRVRGNAIRIGRVQNGPADLGMNPKQRGRHLYAVGSSGAGKSKLLEYLIRQDIKAWPQTKCGLLLLDPHGEVYWNTIKWLAAGGSAALKRPVVPIDLTQDQHVVAYNLLKRRTSATAAVVVGAMMSAIVHVFGADSLRATPLLGRWLQNTLRLLYDRQMTLVELVPLLEDEGFRDGLIQATTDAMARRDWQTVAHFSPEKFEEKIGSTLNRLSTFIRNDLLSASFGQTQTSLDLREAIEKGWTRFNAFFSLLLRCSSFSIGAKLISRYMTR
jgi:Helicase HerA, central domain